MAKTDDLEQPLHEANELITQYRQIACSAISDAESWLRQDALSRAIAEAMPDAVVVTDEAGSILLVNSQFELMFGYPRSEVIGKMVEMLVPEAARAQHIDHRHRYVDDPKVRNMGENCQLTALRKNGTEFKVTIRLGPTVLPNGIFIIGIIRRVRE